MRPSPNAPKSARRPVDLPHASAVQPGLKKARGGMRLEMWAEERWVEGFLQHCLATLLGRHPAIELLNPYAALLGTVLPKFPRNMASR